MTMTLCAFKSCLLTPSVLNSRRQPQLAASSTTPELRAASRFLAHQQGLGFTCFRDGPLWRSCELCCILLQRCSADTRHLPSSMRHLPSSMRAQA